MLDILLQLKHNGIKNYMKQQYNEKRDSVAIEMIFNKIILNKFEKEYNTLVTFKNSDRNDESCYYQTLVFNSNDLMSNIFQYIQFRHMTHCCVVCSHWFYHSWNKNSIYKVDLGWIMKHNIIDATVWQR